MVQLLLLWLLSGVVVDTNLLTGEKVRGELQAVSADGLSLRVKGQPQTFTRDVLKDVVFRTASEQPAAAIGFVQFFDQSVLAIDAVRLSDGRVRASSFGEEWTADISTVRGIRLLSPGEALQEQWDEILNKENSEDLLVIRRAENLDYLAGLVVGVSAEAIQFEYSGNTIPVPFSRAAGVIFARKALTFPPPRIRVRARDGSQWMAVSAQLDGNRLQLVSTAKVKTSVLIQHIANIEYPEMAAVFLADLEPSSVEYEPFFGSTTILPALAEFAAPRKNQGFDAQPLRIADPTRLTGWQQFRSGLALQSKTELSYRLAGKYRNFRATAGLDPSADGQGHVDLVLLADDRPIYRQAIAAAEPPVLVDVDVTNVLRLKVIVDFGANMDVGDRLHLGDARLTK